MKNTNAPTASTEAIPTRDRIIDEALTLFSTKGYSATTTKNIARAVGIKDSSLYKHFASKQAIFQACVDKMDARMDAMGSMIGLPSGRSPAADASAFVGIDADSLAAMSREAFLFYLEDSFASRYRRMLVLAQYDSPDMAGRFRDLFMDRAIGYQQQVFGTLVEQGELTGDPAAMALEYYAAIFFLIMRYDGDIGGRQEALAAVERHVREFVDRYAAKRVTRPVERSPATCVS